MFSPQEIVQYRKALFGSNNFHTKFEGIHSIGKKSHQRVWNKGKLKTLPKERKTSTRKTNEIKHPLQLKGRNLCLLLLPPVPLKFCPIQIAKSFNSYVLESCSCSLFVLSYSCVFFSILVFCIPLFQTDPF